MCETTRNVFEARLKFHLRHFRLFLETEKTDGEFTSDLDLLGVVNKLASTKKGTKGDAPLFSIKKVGSFVIILSHMLCQ